MVLVLGLAVLVLLFAEHRDAAGLRAVSKLGASTSFLALAWGGGAMDSSYGQAVFVALLLSWIGDACLLSKADGVFKAGIFAFLLGHVGFCAAFVVIGIAPGWLGGGALLVSGIALAIDRWLYPQVTVDFKKAVRAYMFVISVMVSLALGAFGAGHSWLIPVGAAAFFLSDMTVAMDRFVKPRFINRVVGLPLYYGAQVLLALSVAG